MDHQEPTAMATKHHHHFLIVTYPAQGHITPARHLARRLAAACPGARATICAPLSAFRRMFPGAPSTGEETDDDHVSYVAYSDGYDGGFDLATDTYASYMEHARPAGKRSLAAALRRLRAAGRPVTCAVYTLLLPWVAAVARDHGVAATAVFWIQPATALAAYYHYFRGHRDAIVAAAKSGNAGEEEVRLPGLPMLRVRDMPSFLAIVDENDPFAFVLPEFRELIDAVEERGGSSRTYVLANTFDAMEHDALASLSPHVDVFAVGPVLSFLHEEADDAAKRTLLSPPRDVFDHDKNGYLDWLDTNPAKSVVYISFGSSSMISKNQFAEITNAMARIKKPFLLVLRKDNCKDGDDAAAIKKLAATDNNVGMVVAWCDQARVLSHPSVSCFVTHGGWNSTLEAVACGVPLVVAPQYSDQGTAAWLVAERVGAGVRAAAREADGVVEAEEVVRCVEVATSEVVVARAAAWKEEARAAVADGGGSKRRLREFLSQIAGDCN